MPVKGMHRALLWTAALCVAVCSCDATETPAESARTAAAIMNAANDGEVQVGQLAQTRAVDTEVKDFAKAMVEQHTATKQRQTTLIERLGILPQEGATSQSLRTDASTMLSTLSSRSGTDFDKEYVSGQATMHQRVLDLLDDEILPDQLPEELKSDLLRTRSDVSMHLQRAVTLKTKLGSP